MLNPIQVECSSEILIGLHMDADDFSSFMKLRTAIALFREGKPGFAPAPAANDHPDAKLTSP